jgi:GntR family transcriptional repressor for pyruvate dehydrogenase complex
MGRVVKQNLADRVIEEIRRMIESGELKEGDKLPNQYELATQMGVSRSVLREAFHTLALMGVIEQSPGVGTIVRRQVPNVPFNQFHLSLVSNAQETRDLIQARRYIEVGTVELAVQKATDAQIEQMKTLIEEMTEALENHRPTEYIEKDAVFHQLIAEASNNRFIASVFTEIHNSLRQFIHESFSVLPGELERSLNAHRRIYMAIKERNQKKAVREMTRHILEVQEAIEYYYETVVNKDTEQQGLEEELTTLPT